MMEVTDFHSRTTPIISQLRNNDRARHRTNRQREEPSRNNGPTTVQGSRASSPAETPSPSKDGMQKLWRDINLGLLRTRVNIAEMNLKQAELKYLQEDFFDKKPSKIKCVRCGEDNDAPSHQVDKNVKQSCHTTTAHNPTNQSSDTDEQLNNNSILSRTDRRRRIKALKKEIHQLKNQERLSELSFPKHITNSLETHKTPARPLPRPVNIADTAQMCSSSLPGFSGASDDWLKYKAAYDSTKHNFNSIENAERIKKSLSGDALALNAHVMSNNNPDYIIREIEKIFGCPDSIAYGESQRLSTLPVCTDSAMDIRMFASKIKDALIKFKALKMDWYIINSDLLKDLKAKLPLSIKGIWCNILADNPNANLITFIEFLDKQADARMKSKGAKSLQKPVKSSRELNETTIKFEYNDFNTPMETH